MLFTTDDKSFKLRRILNNPEIKAVEASSQSYVKNLQGRSICLDIKATDAAGKIFNVEVQRKDNGANPKRARYHSSLIDANLILPGENLGLVSVTSAVNAQALKALTRAHEGVHTGRCTGCPPYA